MHRAFSADEFMIACETTCPAESSEHAWWVGEERAARACIALLALRRKRRSPLVTYNVEVSLWEACVVRHVWETRAQAVWERDDLSDGDERAMKRHAPSI